MNKTSPPSKRKPGRAIVRSLRVLIVTGSLISSVVSVRADTFWFIPLTGNWSAPGNWTQNWLPATRYPRVGDFVILDSSKTIIQNILSLSIDSLLMQGTPSALNDNQCLLTLQGDLESTGPVQIMSHVVPPYKGESVLQLNDFNLTMQGGSLVVRGQTNGSIVGTATLQSAPDSGGLSTVTLIGSAVFGGLVSRVELYNLTVGDGVAARTTGLGGPVAVKGTLIVRENATLDLGTYDLAIGARLQPSDASTGGTILIVDGAVQSWGQGRLLVGKNMANLTGTGTLAVNNLEMIAGTGAGQITTISVNTSVSGQLIMQSKHRVILTSILTLKLGSGTPLEPLAANGTGAGLTVQPSATVVYGQPVDALITTTGKVLGFSGNLTVNGSSGATFFHDAGMAIGGDLRLTSGKLTFPAVARTPGQLSVSGGYVQSSGGTLILEAGGPTPVTQHDVLNITGNAQLGGTLEFRLAGGYAPAGGTRLVMLRAADVTGNFSTVNSPDVPIGVVYEDTAVVVVINGTAVLPSNQSLPHAFSFIGFSGTVRYSIPHQCQVSLKYYDVRGRLVVSLVDRVQGQGSYSLAVPVSQLARGTYIQVFKAGSFITKKMFAIVR